MRGKEEEEVGIAPYTQPMEMDSKMASIITLAPLQA